MIWIGSEPIEGAQEAIDVLNQREIAHCFFTNNATASRQQYLGKFERLGFKGVSLEQVQTSGSASAQYLAETLLPTLPE